MKNLFISLAALFVLGAIVHFSNPTEPSPDFKKTSSDLSARTKKSFRRSIASSRQQADSDGSRLAQPDTQTVTAYLEKLRSALTAGREIEAESARRYLAWKLENHPERIDELLALLKVENDPSLLTILADVIGGDKKAMKNPAVLEAILKTASEDTSPIRRSMALRVLAGEGLKEIPVELKDRVIEFSREDSDVNVRKCAIAAMGSWMSRSPELQSELSWQLVQTINTSADEGVRAQAIQAIAIREMDMPIELVRTMANYLVADTDPENRAMAGLSLALAKVDGDKRAEVVHTLEEAYKSEKNLDARRNLLTHLMVAAKGDFLAMLDQLPAEDPLLVQDQNDYREIIASGVTDPEKIYARKSDLDGSRGTLPWGKATHD